MQLLGRLLVSELDLETDRSCISHCFPSPCAAAGSGFCSLQAQPFAPELSLPRSENTVGFSALPGSEVWLELCYFELEAQGWGVVVPFQSSRRSWCTFKFENGWHRVKAQMEVEAVISSICLKFGGSICCCFSLQLKNTIVSFTWGKNPLLFSYTTILCMLEELFKGNV